MVTAEGGVQVPSPTHILAPRGAQETGDFQPLVGLSDLQLQAERFVDRLVLLGRCLAEQLGVAANRPQPGRDLVTIQLCRCRLAEPFEIRLRVCDVGFSLGELRTCRWQRVGRVFHQLVDALLPMLGSDKSSLQPGPFLVPVVVVTSDFGNLAGPLVHRCCIQNICQPGIEQRHDKMFVQCDHLGMVRDPNPTEFASAWTTNKKFNQAQAAKPLDHSSGPFQ